MVIQVEKFIETSNSKAGPGKVTLKEIQKHMLEHAPPSLRVRIPRSSLSYMLRKHMGYVYAYTKKKGALMKGEKRHARIRRFVIEMHQALKEQEKGECVIVFTDETYIHQNHSPLMSWVKSGDRSVEKTTSKGKRLIVLHAITTEDFITMNDENGFPIAEGAFEGENVVMKTAEWIWQASPRALNLRRAFTKTSTRVCAAGEAQEGGLPRQHGRRNVRALARNAPHPCVRGEVR